MTKNLVKRAVDMSDDDTEVDSNIEYLMQWDGASETDMIAAQAARD